MSSCREPVVQVSSARSPSVGKPGVLWATSPKVPIPARRSERRSPQLWRGAHWSLSQLLTWQSLRLVLPEVKTKNGKIQPKVDIVPKRRWKVQESFRFFHIEWKGSKRGVSLYENRPLLIADAQLVGADPCTWGPDYWCSSLANARKCDVRCRNLPSLRMEGTNRMN
ncbi:hypothetical protein OUZ56_020131 [Daphnia magna]|uniref:Saposin A-type domain-containing protein n=1 Tax=Daphnia magna TaxID=35525 RepID=A0ABQ9ZDL8_9CRUS|nr:hypothetical protein OUZ56_020131 [Daphnia magna]